MDQTEGINNTKLLFKKYLKELDQQTKEIKLKFLESQNNIKKL